MFPDNIKLTPELIKKIYRRFPEFKYLIDQAVATGKPFLMRKVYTLARLLLASPDEALETFLSGALATRPVLIGHVSEGLPVLEPRMPIVLDLDFLRKTVVFLGWWIVGRAGFCIIYTIKSDLTKLYKRS